MLEIILENPLKFIHTYWLIPKIVGVLVASLATWFYWSYWRISSKVKSLLKQVINKLKPLRRHFTKDIVHPSKIEEVMKLPGNSLSNSTFDKGYIVTLTHLWDEYQETLHEQWDIDSVTGEKRIIKYRATIPSEVFFNTQVLVDTPMSTEFFRHLPGILTGIGIIGTFGGLIIGLLQFHPNTADPSKVKESLDFLLSGVLQAFVASAIAISFAMIITSIEKGLIKNRYKQVEELTQAIDALYEAGAGEEYLSRLVKASEENETHARHLKDSLINDLKSILIELQNSHVSTMQKNNEYLVNGFQHALTTGIQEPLDKIAGVVKSASGEQGHAVHGMLEDLLSAFMAKLDSAFGGQIGNLNEMMGQSVRSMHEMQNAIQQLVADLGNAGKDSTVAMSQQLAKMMQEAEVRQQTMNRQMQEFVEQIRLQVIGTQSQSHDQLNKAIEAMSSQMRVVMDDFSQQRRSVAEQEIQREAHVSEKTEQFIGQIGNELDTFVKQANESVSAMNENVMALREVSLKAIEGMNSGAESMYIASQEFSNAGNKLSLAFNNGSDILSKMVHVSAGLDTSAKTVQEVVAAYNQTRTSLTVMVASLQKLVDEADVKAGVNRNIVADMQKSMEAISAVEKQTQEYLGKINEVLLSAFNEFGEAITRNTGKANADFHTNLSTAVGMLSGQIDELQSALESLTDRLNQWPKK